MRHRMGTGKYADCANSPLETPRHKKYTSSIHCGRRNLVGQSECWSQEVMMIKPRYIDKDEADERGIEEGWYPVDRDGNPLTDSPFP